MGSLLYYLILKPLSYLPLWVLYRLSDCMAPIVYHLVRYRRKVTRQNLLRAFPEKGLKEVKRIERRYYRHLCDLVVEAIYGLSATPIEVAHHYQLLNPELLKRYYEQGQSVVLVSAHYNNWEYMVLGINFLLCHHGVGVGKPLNDKGIGRFIDRARVRYGDEVVSHLDVRETMEYYYQRHVPCAYMMLADQSPSNPRKCFWCRFLGQETGFIYGPEHFARKYRMPVVFYEVRHTPRRGFYRVVFHNLCPDPAQCAEGTITADYVQRLEEQIRFAPEYWLWSHRRWKHKKS